MTDRVSEPSDVGCTVVLGSDRRARRRLTGQRNFARRDQAFYEKTQFSQNIPALADGSENGGFDAGLRHPHPLYDPRSDLLLWGIDDLLVYHYLVAESIRYLDIRSRISEAAQGRAGRRDWNQLFIEHSPVSEACQES